MQEAGLYVLCGLLPFSKAAIEIAFGVLLIGWLAERLNPATRWQTVWLDGRLRSLAWALGAYLAACALSIPLSDAPSLSVRGFVRKWLEYALLFVMMAELGARPTLVRRAMALLACSSLLVLIQAISQEITIWRTISHYDSRFVYGRMMGPYENPIDLATYLMVVVPVLLMFAPACRPPLRRAIWTLATLLIVCVGRTQAQGAWVGLGVGLVLLAMWERRIRKAVLMTALVALSLIGLWLHAGGRLQQAVTTFDRGFQDRLYMWQAAWGMIRDRPVVGHGLNTFMARYLDYWVGGERAPRYAHNGYLQIWAETGLIGLGTFLWLLWRMWTGWLAGARSALDDRHRMFLLGMVAGLLAFLVQSAVDTNFYSLRQATLFWALAGLATGLAVVIGQRGVQQTRTP
ncbi:MAG: O-antigen ligase family protein [Candidatus Omnitrophica bacterium]|nr:O-antigen ligase family protein [Candidatus Omnitrophota bacterium]